MTDENLYPRPEPPEKPDPELPPAHASDEEYVAKLIAETKKRLAEKGAKS